MRAPIRPIIAAVLLAACTPAPPRAANSGATNFVSDTLPIRHRPASGVLSLDAGSLRELRVREPFIYVGGQRFILRATADAEQHLFVVADSADVVQRLYWIQIEELLPSESEPYDYTADSVVSVDGFPLAANFRTYDAPPDSGSDRARAFGYLEGRGYRIPHGGTRVRLVYLPEPAARREVMIIYFESSAAAASSSYGALTGRATANLTLRGAASP